jgi:benzodiazapine receptor
MRNHLLFVLVVVASPRAEAASQWEQSFALPRTTSTFGSATRTRREVADFDPQDNISLRESRDDSNPALLFKLGVSAIFEAAAFLGVMKLGSAGKKHFNIPKVLSQFCVVFGGSVIGNAVKTGVVAASNQVLRPNQKPGDPQWYNRLKKPSWNPPGWIFPIMWLIVSKPTQLAALTQLPEGTWIPLCFYCLHLALGDMWNQVFFEYQSAERGAAVITVFYLMLLTSTALFAQVNPLAGRLMLPTCGWVTVAAALNWNIYLTNKKK